MLNKFLLLLTFTCGVAFAGDPSVIDFPDKHCRNTWKHLIHKGQHYFKTKEPHSFDNNGVNLDYKLFFDPLKRYDCHKDWTVLIYMQADNNLRPYAFWDLAEMESAFHGKRANGSTLKLDVLVHLDTDQDRKLRRYHIYQSKKNMPHSDVEYYKAWSDKNISSPIVQELDEEIETLKPQSEVFKEFLQWGMANYPSKHYMVIIWGHGQGWSDTPAVQFGGIATDESDQQRISITGIRKTLNSLRSASTTKEKVDVVVADACLMQTIEVASELGGEARYVIGSTQIQNFMGLPYRRLFYEINTGDWHGLGKDPKYVDEPYRMAAMIPKLVKSTFQPRNGGRGYHQADFDPDAWTHFTMSSVNAEELNRQGFGVFQKLADGIIDSLNQDPFLSSELSLLIENVEYFLGGTRDIYYLMAKLEKFYRDRVSNFKPQTIKKIFDAITGIRKLINETLIAYYYGQEYWAKNNNYYLGQFKAFGIWLPSDQENMLINASRLKNSYFVQQFSNSNWLVWMERLYSGGAL